MSAAGSVEIQPGERLGYINFWSEYGEFVRNVGSLNEGLIPEESVLSSSNTQAFIARGNVPGVGTEELVITVEQGETEATIGLQARTEESEAPSYVSPDLVEGSLKMAMQIAEVRTARFKGPTSLPGSVAEKFRLADKGKSGIRIVRPPLKPILGVSSSIW